MRYRVNQSERLSVVYSDAESHGSIAAVFVFEDTVQYMHGVIPGRLRRLLRVRKTNIVAYEFNAAAMAAVMADMVFPRSIGFRHFVDSKPALCCIFKGSSLQEDLNSLAGLVWYMAGSRMCAYWGQSVRSSCNLDDKLSRGDYQHMIRLGATSLTCDLFVISGEAEEWLQSPRGTLLVQ